MAMIPPPEGLSAEDYDAIEAAVVETVRGRWFLAEYARRSRVEEVRQMLDGLARLELTVREQQQLPADPSIRLLVQRLKDVSQKLETIAGGMRADGVEAHYCADVETQARAVSGLLRSAPQVKLDTPRVADVRPAMRPEPLPPAAAAPLAPVERAMPEPPPAPPRPLVPPLSTPFPARADQGAALTRLDRLSTAEKVALFS
ncbi:MAG: hypothetical protein ACLQL2_04465 [Methylovirgula sp.]